MENAAASKLGNFSWASQYCDREFSAQPMLVYRWHGHSSAKQVSLLKEPEFNEGSQHFGHDGQGTCKSRQHLGAR